ncbi:hypothetical protein GS597_17860 [Synechococcales cyanobacterium C]|uniref:Putative restriction endonuclease domain-containing protein n=1 Tax=Petrachloros mirabilis ULC683 TaxID=2781853 RepID=A0A8K2A1X7_9CYAN|nr:Uma2 family endonuclease [Petrachloros mirabilis]NCJ08338.1 hypothetical protein [Petrachloros mirabilis ULC683]
MAFSRSIAQSDPPRSPREVQPTMYDLPSEDPEEPGLPDEFHLLQPQLLSLTFQPPTYPADQIFTASDLNLYYDLRRTWYKRPDWFAVVGIPRLYEERHLRLSYVMWQEGVRPIVAVELLSAGTQAEDLGQTSRTPEQPPTKWQVYEQILGIPYYVVFDRYSDRLRAFQLVSDRYQELNLSEPRIWMPTLNLGLGLWEGEYQGIHRPWLRWYDAKQNWVSTEVEAERQKAEQAEHRAEQERQRAEQEHQRAERLAARLKALGIDPDA